MDTILIIDDDSSFAGLLAPFLATEGWEVIAAADGESGLRLVEERRPRVILCDLLMPRRNGYQVCRAIRGDPQKYGAPKIIITSGAPYPSDQKNALESGADAFLLKPVHPKTIADLLATGRPAAPQASAERTRIRFWGVRGSIPTPGPTTLRYGGNTSCVEVRADGQIIVLDAGTGLRLLGLELAEEFKGRSIDLTLLISHTHWDHIQGFPFFLPAYDPNNHVRILGFDGARRGLERTFSSQMESPYFPIALEQMPGNIRIEELKDLEFRVGTVLVRAMFLNHPGICVGYRLFTPSGSVAYLPDNELHQPQQAPSSAEQETDYVVKYAQSQDQKIIDFVRGADAVIIDSQYDSSEYPSHIGWGHSCVDDTVRLALAAEAKRLLLFHHDPAHDDAHIERMLETAREIARNSGKRLEIDAAREGLDLILDAEEAKGDKGAAGTYRLTPAP